MSTQATVRVLGPEDHGREVSYEDFAEAEFVESWTYEREGGRLAVMAPEGQKHIDASEPWLKRLVAYWLMNPERVQHVVPNAWVRIGRKTDRIGDLGVYLVDIGLAPPIPDRVPEIMFEVVSPGKESRDRDYIKKRREYYRLGIREYVVVDRFKKTVTIFNPGPSGYRKRVLTVADDYASPLLPGLVIPLSEVF